MQSSPSNRVCLWAKRKGSGGKKLQHNQVKQYVVFLKTRNKLINRRREEGEGGKGFFSLGALDMRSCCPV